MTKAEEKAKGLIDKFMAVEVGVATKVSLKRFDNRFNLNFKSAKQCALICVDEILFVIGEPTYFQETKVFYKKVKESINNL